MSIIVNAQLDRAKISKESDYEGHLMVKLEAKDEKFQRKTVKVALVLDISGSMSSHMEAGGGQKIEAMRKTAHLIVDNLTTNDSIALVTFTDDARLLVPLVKVADKEHLHRSINGMHPVSMTNLSGALLMGAEQLADAKETDITRVLVLTDGLPTCGLQDPAALVHLVSERKNKNVVFSFFGLGKDCDHELLTSLAKAGGGKFLLL